MKILCRGCEGTGRNIKFYGTKHGNTMGIPTVCKLCKGLGRVTWHNTIK